MEFKDNVQQISTDNFWYDLFWGGYINPKDLLKNEDDVVAIKNAMELLYKFHSEAIINGVVCEDM